MVRISINESCLGSGCALCVKTCMRDVFGVDGEKTIILSSENCVLCGQCVAICPQESINHDAFPDRLEETAERIETDILMKDLASVRSIRRFQKKDIPKEDLQTLIKAASFAPTAYNRREIIIDVYQEDELGRITEHAIGTVRSMVKMLERPMMGILARIAGKRGEFEKGKRFLPELKKTIRDWQDGRDKIFFNAPAVMIMHGPNTEFAIADAYIASSNIRMVARSLSLGSVYSGYFIQLANYDKSLGELLGIPSGSRIHAVVAIGYQKYAFMRIPTRPLPISNWH